MSVLGSVFLGDAQRQLSLSPPISPSTSPPSNAPSFSLSANMHAVNDGPPNSVSSELTPLPPIDPALSLELRIRWLEVLLLGVKQDQNSTLSAPPRSSKTALVRGVEQLHGKLKEVVQGNEGLRKFIDRYDRHTDILNPSFALSGIASPANQSSLTPEELNAMLVEMEPELRSADRDLREIDILEKRGVLGAGKLADYKELFPRLDALQKAQREDVQTASNLEKRIADVLRRYTTRVDALSELFVEWNDILSSAEDKVSRLERDKADRKRLGL